MGDLLMKQQPPPDAAPILKPQSVETSLERATSYYEASKRLTANPSTAPDVKNAINEVNKNRNKLGNENYIKEIDNIINKYNLRDTFNKILTEINKIQPITLDSAGMGIAWKQGNDLLKEGTDKMAEVVGGEDTKADVRKKKLEELDGKLN